MEQSEEINKTKHIQSTSQQYLLQWTSEHIKPTIMQDYNTQAEYADKEYNGPGW
jgi:hypothetical protein